MIMGNNFMFKFIINNIIRVVHSITHFFFVLTYIITRFVHIHKNIIIILDYIVNSKGLVFLENR